MTTYRSRPVVIEAMQWETNGNTWITQEQLAANIVAWVNANGGEAVYHPQGDGVDASLGGPVIGVRTINGWAYAKPGHYVVKGKATFEAFTKGDPGGMPKTLVDFYPCDPQTFMERWEMADA